MKVYKSLTAGIVLMFFFLTAKAQFSLTGEFRPRTEFSHGYKTLANKNQNWSIATAQRSRLNALYSNQVIRTKLVLQDVRFWGSQPQLVANEDYGVSVHEAWAEVEIAQNISLKAGRQELVYDDSRILGNVGWAHQARSHDLVLLKYNRDFNLHFGIAHHENGHPADNIYNGPDAYKDLQFFWFNKSWEDNSLSLLFLNNGVPFMEFNEQKTRYSQTIGGRFSTTMKSFSLATNLYYQFGKHISGNEISALNFLAEASINYGISVGYEYLSGNSYDKNDKEYAFTPLYGTNHKFNGFMDYFFVGNHINSVGLNDVYLKFNGSKNNIGYQADLHYFASAGKISENASTYLGTEIDLSVSWKIHEWAALSAGWSTILAEESMELLKGGDYTSGNHWAYLMLTVIPEFIK